MINIIVNMKSIIAIPMKHTIAEITVNTDLSIFRIITEHTKLAITRTIAPINNPNSYKL